MAEAASGSQDRSVQVKLVLLGVHLFPQPPRFSILDSYQSTNLDPYR